jgi:hypothetical protein
LKIVPSPLHDSVLWTPSASGSFTTKSVHHLISSLGPASPSPLSQSHWKALWKLNLTRRLKLFLWNMVWNIIPTKFRIFQTIQSSHPDTSCSLCSFPLDFTLHLFFSCLIARVVWRQSFWPLDSLALPVYNMTEWLLIILNPATISIPHTASHMFQIFVAVACDQLCFPGTRLIMIKLFPMLLLSQLLLTGLFWSIILHGLRL